MQVILGKDEVQSAIECYLAQEGININKYDLDIKIVVSRASDDTKIEIDMVQKKVIEPVEQPAYMVDEVKPATSPFGDVEATVSE